MGSCSATSETHNKRKNAHTADDINFSSLFFEICFLLFGLLFFPFSAGRSEERGVGGLAAGGWPGKKVEIGEGEEIGGGSGFS